MIGDPALWRAAVAAMSRRIAVDLYAKLVALRADWHDDDPLAQEDANRGGWIAGLLPTRPEWGRHDCEHIRVAEGG